MARGFRASFAPLRCVATRLLPALAVGAALVGCAGSWPLAKDTKPATKAVSVFYVGASSLPLHREPGGAVVEQLANGTKVSRSRLEKGWAFVRVATSGREGWVDNAKLVWREPRAESHAEPSPEPEAAEQPAEPEAEEQPAEPAAEPTPAPVADETPAPDTTESEGTSVYDPF